MSLLDETITKLEQHAGGPFPLHDLLVELGGDVSTPYRMHPNTMLLYLLCLALRKVRGGGVV